MFQQPQRNRFSQFAEVDQELGSTATVVKTAPKPNVPKKQVIIRAKAADQPVAEGEEFARIERPVTAHRGGDRGGRGGRGNGERRGGEGRGRGGEGRGRGGEGRGRGGEGRGRGGEGRGRGGEGRGGRGRGGDRPRTAVDGEHRAKTAHVEGEEGAPVVERAERGGYREKFQGKPREGAHPMDRQDGTGRGRRGDRKDGEGKGSWGNDKKPLAEGEVPAEGKPEGEREHRERKPREPREPRERREKPTEEVKKPEPVEEEEEGFTLDDFLAQKQAKSKGLLVKKDQRAHDKMDTKNIKEELTATELIVAGSSQLSAQDTHKVVRGTGAELMGFQKEEQNDYQESRGGRGGRGGRGAFGGDRPQTSAPRGGRQAGRKGGKLIVDDNDFPTL